ncbi:uncharacterized protein EV422DRAFT_494841 [Fimicolochytrium jonesii]|uniref:uncharacterized protein n=1 Tax=Fimicolochytrium jonesii TaxID=1396493 RepID=UPI0022FED603|nr:uncharacterized protein EV422DRAFT_494841 [Fimicolochytrium jonesii]KAI8822443.1 hypothetical protein EV422DRAFT_494841 [Fimicolochytrium jonesii]
MEYRGRLLGLQDSDFVAISHENTDTATQGKRGTFLVLDDLLTTAEIAQLLAEASAQRFGQPHNKHGEFIDDASLRNDVAVTIRWESVAQLLWPRIQSFLPDHSLRRFGRRGSLNPRLRFSKYGPGGKFRCHYDSPFIDPDDPHNVSQYTLLVYLTEVAEGGETRFVDAEHTPPLVLDVKPKAGRAVVFDYNVMHCGREVVAGEKVVMKADVMVENTRAKLPPGALD